MEHWFTRRNLSLLALLVGTAAIGSYFYQQQAERKEERGKAALFKALQTQEAEEKALPEEERGAGSPLDVDARFAKTRGELKEILSRPDVTARTRFEAALRLGALYLEHQKPETALEFLKTGREAAGTSFQKASANLLLGTALERSQQFRESAESYEQGLGQNVEALKPDFLLGLVRVSLQLKDPAKAKSFSERLQKEAPKSSATETAQALVKDLK